MKVNSTLMGLESPRFQKHLVLTVLFVLMLNGCANRQAFAHLQLQRYKFTG
jgi:hypothetical protein